MSISNNSICSESVSKDMHYDTNHISDFVRPPRDDFSTEESETHDRVFCSTFISPEPRTNQSLKNKQSWGSSILSDELWNENRKLALMVKELKDLNTLLQSQNTGYIEKLSEAMKDCFEAKLVAENLKERYECIEKTNEYYVQENSTLRIKLQQSEAKINQHESLKEGQNADVLQVSDLNVELNKKAKCVQILKNSQKPLHAEISEENQVSEKMKNHLKNNWTNLMKFGKKQNDMGHERVQESFQNFPGVHIEDSNSHATRLDCTRFGTTCYPESSSADPAQTLTGSPDKYDICTRSTELEVSDLCETEFISGTAFTASDSALKFKSVYKVGSNDQFIEPIAVNTWNGNAIYSDDEVSEISCNSVIDTTKSVQKVRSVSDTFRECSDIDICTNDEEVSEVFRTQSDPLTAASNYCKATFNDCSYVDVCTLDEEVSEVFRTQYDPLTAASNCRKVTFSPIQKMKDKNQLMSMDDTDDVITETYNERRKPQKQQKQSLILRECYVRLERLQIHTDMDNHPLSWTVMDNHPLEDCDVIPAEDEDEQYEQDEDLSKTLCNLPAASTEISNAAFARMGCTRLRNIDKLCYQKKFDEDILMPFIQNSTGREVIIKQESYESLNSFDEGSETTSEHFNPAIADIPESDEDRLSDPISLERTLYFHDEENANSSDSAECSWENENAQGDNPNNSFNAGWNEWIKTCKKTPPSRFVRIATQRQTMQELPEKKQPSKRNVKSTQVKTKRKKIWFRNYTRYDKRKAKKLRLQNQARYAKHTQKISSTKSNSQPVVSSETIGLELDSSSINALIDPHQDSVNLEHGKEDINQHFDPSSSDDSIDMCIREFGCEISEIDETKSESNIAWNKLHHETEDGNNLLHASDSDGSIIPIESFHQEIDKLGEMESGSKKEVINPCQETLQSESGNHLSDASYSDDSIDDCVKYFYQEISKIGENEPESEEALIVPSQGSLHPEQILENKNELLNTCVSDDCVDSCDIYFNKKVSKISKNKSDSINMLDNPCQEALYPVCEIEQKKLSTVSFVSDDSCDISIHTSNLKISRKNKTESISMKTFINPSLQEENPLFERTDNFKFKDISVSNISLDDLEPEISKIDEIEPNSKKELSMPCLDFVKPLQEEEDLNMPMNDLEPEISKVHEIEPNTTKKLSMPCLDFVKPLQEEEDLNMPMNDLEPEISKVNEIEPNTTKKLPVPCLEFVKPLQEEEGVNMSTNDLEQETFSLILEQFSKIGEIESNLVNEMSNPCLDAEESFQNKKCEHKSIATSKSDFVLFEANSIPNSNQASSKICEIGGFTVSNLTNTFPEINSVQKADNQHKLIDLPAFVDDNFIDVNNCNKSQRLNLLKQPLLLSAFPPHMKELRKIPKQVPKITFLKNQNLILQHSDHSTIPNVNLQTTSKDYNLSDQLNISKLKKIPSLQKSCNISKFNLDVDGIETSLFSSQSSNDTNQSKNIGYSSDPVSTSYEILDFGDDICKTSDVEPSDDKHKDLLDADKSFTGDYKILNPSETPCKRQICLVESSGDCRALDSEDNSDVHDLNISRNRCLASNPRFDEAINSCTKETTPIPTKRNASEMNLDITDSINERPSKIHRKHEANIVSPEHHVFLKPPIPMKMLKTPEERHSLKFSETWCENDSSLTQDRYVYIEPFTEISKKCCKETNFDKTEQTNKSITVPKCDVRLEPLISSINNSDEKYSINMDTFQMLDTMHTQNNPFNALKGKTTMEFQKAAEHVPSQCSTESDSDNDVLETKNYTKSVEGDIFMCNKEESKNETMFEATPVISHFVSKRNLVKSRNLTVNIDSLNKSRENEESNKTGHSSVHYDTNGYASDEKNVGQILKKNLFSNLLMEGTEYVSELQIADEKEISPQRSDFEDDRFIIADDTVAVKQDEFECEKYDSKKDATVHSSVHYDTNEYASGKKNTSEILKKNHFSNLLMEGTEYGFEFQTADEKEISPQGSDSEDDRLVIADDTVAIEQDDFECEKSDSKKDATFNESILTNTLVINDSAKKEVGKRKLNISPKSSTPNEQTCKRMKRHVAMNSNSTSPHNNLSVSDNKNIENKSPRKQENESPEKNMSIYSALMNIKDIKYSNLFWKKDENILFNVLIDPSNAPNNATLLFYVFRYLTFCKTNPFMVYDHTNNSSELFPLDEVCVISVLFRIEQASKPHLQELLATALNSIHEIVLSKTNLNMLGLSSLCRVLTGICKRKRNPQKPLSLCCDLLKMKHKFAPFLIASVAGIWKELFQVSHNMSDEEVVFHSAIAYGARTRTFVFRNNTYLWQIIHKFLSQTLTAPAVSNIKKTMDFLINRIQVKVINGSSPDYEYALTTPLVIFAVYSSWSWTKANLLDIHIVPNLAKYGIEELNEKAFDVFCNIYAEIFPFCDESNQTDEVLIYFFGKTSADKGDNFVQNCAARALIKYLLAKKSLIPSALQTWFERNRTSPKVAPLSLLFRRKKMSEIKFSQNDILTV